MGEKRNSRTADTFYNKAVPEQRKNKILCKKIQKGTEKIQNIENELLQIIGEVNVILSRLNALHETTGFKLFCRKLFRDIFQNFYSEPSNFLIYKKIFLTYLPTFQKLEVCLFFLSHVANADTMHETDLKIFQRIKRAITKIENENANKIECKLLDSKDTYLPRSTFYYQTKDARAKLKRKRKNKILTMHKSGSSKKEIAEKEGCSISTVSRILNKKN